MGTDTHRTPTAILADHLLPDGLDAFVTQHRDSKPRRSWDWIARELWVITDRKVDVTGVTLASWFEPSAAKPVAS